uniref:Uncharacterized protein n=1 Tax=Meloidogyne enterolobii TaxID=390850 RepID=A0A6V7YB85_MELEN|nr:unnamed protein product [Meloidogyne enterolobii]
MKDERYQYFIKLFKNGDLNVNFRTRFIKDYLNRDKDIFQKFINLFGVESINKFTISIIMTEFQNDEDKSPNICDMEKKGKKGENLIYKISFRKSYSW